MKSRIVNLLGVACAVALSGTAGSPALATNITFSTNDCQPVPWAAPSARYAPEYTVNGVLNPGDSPNYIIFCDVPRSPLPIGATIGYFYVDGDNYSGAVTGCTVYSVDYTGVVLGSAGFSASAASYDQLVSMPATQLTPWAYIHLICTLPPNRSAILRGITSLQ